MSAKKEDRWVGTTFRRQIGKYTLLRGTRGREVQKMALAYAAGESMPSIAARRGSSIQAVSQQLRPRLLAARAAWEACR